MTGKVKLSENVPVPPAVQCWLEKRVEGVFSSTLRDVWASNKLWQTMESWLSSENILKPYKIAPAAKFFIEPDLSCMVLDHFINSSVFGLCKLVKAIPAVLQKPR